MYHTGPLSGVRLLAAGIPSVILEPLRRRGGCCARSTRTGPRRTVMVPTHFVRLLALPDEVRRRYDVSLDAARRPHRRAVPGRREAGDDRVVGPDLHRRLRRHRGRHGLLDHQRGVARRTRARSAGRSRRSPRSCSTTTATSVPAGAEGRLYFRDATGRGIVYPNDPDKTAAAHLDPACSRSARSATSTTTATSSSPTASATWSCRAGSTSTRPRPSRCSIDHPGVADVAVHRRAQRRHGRGS